MSTFEPARPWDHEREVDAALARELIAAQFPRLAPALVQALGEGWDNSVFLVNGEWVFRFPRRAVAVRLLETELRVLAHVAGKLPLPTPRPELSGAPGERFPWPFAGHRLLSGQTADQLALDDAQRERLARPLGEFLRALHALPPPADLPGDELGRLDAARLIPLVRTRLAELGLDAPAWIDEPVRPARAAALVHGDLHARQLLIDERAWLCGVIDWGDAHLGDPAVDLSTAHALLPRSAHGEFRAAYGDLDEATWRLARLRALHVSAALAVYARHRGAGLLQAEALASIHRLEQP